MDLTADNLFDRGAMDCIGKGEKVITALFLFYPSLPNRFAWTRNCLPPISIIHPLEDAIACMDFFFRLFPSHTENL